ncbi:hypothetical protein U1Q18_029438 [Sarracenia purpurea var. burkii]
MNGAAAATWKINEEQRINTALRARLPELNFSTVVGKWWEQIFTCKKDLGQGNSVSLEVEVQREVVLIGDREAVWDETEMGGGGGGGGGGGMIWFRSVGGGGEVNIGLSSLIVDRMKRRKASESEENGGV